MAKKPGKAIIWQPTNATEWEQLTDEEKAIFIAMATPDAETIVLAQETAVNELVPFLEAELKEDVIIG